MKIVIGNGLLLKVAVRANVVVLVLFDSYLIAYPNVNYLKYSRHVNVLLITPHALW